MSSEDTKILYFNLYWKSDKTPSVIYVDIESLTKKQMDVKTILRNHLQQKQVNTFPADIQYLQFGHLMVQKVIMMYTEVKTA